MSLGRTAHIDRQNKHYPRRVGSTAYPQNESIVTTDAALYVVCDKDWVSTFLVGQQFLGLVETAAG
jgi:hypothetical protein